ncbi:MAG: RsmD family RNA methyltransferase, partial [Vicinamibacterales bacterium]
DVAPSCTVLRGDALVHLRRPPPGPAFDLVFLDPPYDDPALPDALAFAAAQLAPGGRLVLEHARRRQVPDAAGGLRRFRLLEAGDSALSFYAVPAS